MYLVIMLGCSLCFAATLTADCKSYALDQKNLCERMLEYGIVESSYISYFMGRIDSYKDMLQHEENLGEDSKPPHVIFYDDLVAGWPEETEEPEQPIRETPEGWPYDRGS